MITSITILSVGLMHCGFQMEERMGRFSAAHSHEKAYAFLDFRVSFVHHKSCTDCNVNASAYKCMYVV